MTPPVPSRRQFLALAAENNLIPVYRELLADLDTPISIYKKLVGDGEGYLLESVEGGEQVARYSFIGSRPFLRFRGGGHADPLGALRGLLGGFRPAPVPGLPRFYGGLVGYLGYDLVRSLERLESPPPDDLHLPEALLMATELVVSFDHVTRSIKLVYNAVVDGSPEEAYTAAVRALEEAATRLRAPLPGEHHRQAAGAGVAGRSDADSADPRPGPGLVPTANMSREAFLDAVVRAKESIRAGEIFQVVFSQRFAIPQAPPPFDVYRALRNLNPSPYMFYLSFGEVVLAGASPEMLVRVDGGTATTRPIAGTRRRGRDEAEDLRLERELLTDAKERAEHVMLVDLGRNDLGRVCGYGTVEVSRFLSVERYSHVMHLVSEVRGRLAPGQDCLSALAACFPAGTLSGAPKVRAMEIIDEIEPSRRGPYGGAVGYFGFGGNMDTCITIRTVVFAGGRAYLQAGAGIVADSDPQGEYQESLDKAQALIRALELAGEGLG